MFLLKNNKIIGYLLAKKCVILYYNNVKDREHMPELSKEKLNNLKLSKGLTNKKIAELSGVQIATVDKIFSGMSKNPTLETLTKIAFVLDCTIDDLIDYEIEPKSSYYLNKQTAKLAQEIFEDKKKRILMDAARNLTPEALDAMIVVANQIKGTNPNA